MEYNENHPPRRSFKEEMRAEDLEVCQSVIWHKSFCFTVSLQSTWKLRKEERSFLKVSVSHISLPNHFGKRSVGLVNRRVSK